MPNKRSSDTSYLLAFFVMLILCGTLLLSLPGSWAGEGRLSLVDAVFTATSAVCVTGLITVDTAAFSRSGQLIILLLIQLGGLGIISFTSLLLLIPGHRLPFRRLRTIKSYSVEGVEHDPVKIVRSIVIFTILCELGGALALYLLLRNQNVGSTWFTAVFHSISAFCNAGFSTFPDSLERFRANPAILATVSVLISAGGIGFIVLYDVARWLRRKKRRLSFHSKLILGASFILVSGGSLAFFLLERTAALADMSLPQQIMNALFQAVTPRTAGFNAIHQTELGQASKMLTMLLMFIGGAPGSIAGGIKISTAFIILMMMVRRANDRGEIQVFHKRLSPAIINSALVYFVKAVFLLFCAIGLLLLFESSGGANLGHIAFEVVSALGTVGLSLDLTSSLGTWSKLVLVFTMFTGRVGLLAMVYLADNKQHYNITYPEADILIG